MADRDKVKFGYSKVCRPEMVNSDDGLTARKRNPDRDYRSGVMYSEKPLEGVSEFEVEIVRYGGKWSGSIKFGVMKISKQKGLVANDDLMLQITLFGVMMATMTSFSIILVMNK